MARRIASPAGTGAAALALGIVLASASHDAYAQAGFYDTTWRPGGRVTLPQGSELEFVMQTLVPVGDRFLLGGPCDTPNINPNPKTTCVVRINADGTVDSGYGAGGPFFTRGSLVGVPVGGSQLAAADASGRMVLIGDGTGSEGQATIARLSVSGTTFDGPRTIRFNQNSRLSSTRDIAIGADGSIVVVGMADTSSTPFFDFDFAIAKLDSSLALDPSFAGDGTVTIAINEILTGMDSAEAVAIDDAGRLAIAGLAVSPNGVEQLWVARLEPDGSPTPGFGTQGRVRVPRFFPTGFLSVADIVIDRQGRILVSGTLSNSLGNPSVPFVARLRPDGMPDSSFGTQNGTVLIDFDPVLNSTGAETGGKVLVQPDDKIIVGASLFRKRFDTSPFATPLFFGLARLTDQGSYDFSFGAAGRGSGVFGPFPLGPFDDRNAFHTMAFDRVGRLMVAGLYGQSVGGTSKELGLARITTGFVFDPILTDGFE